MLRAESRGARAPESVVIPDRCRFVPRSPAGFVDNVTTPVQPESHPPNASMSPLLVNWRARALPVPALLGAAGMSGGSPRLMVLPTRSV